MCHVTYDIILIFWAVWGGEVRHSPVRLDSGTQRALKAIKALVILELVGLVDRVPIGNKTS